MRFSSASCRVVRPLTMVGGATSTCRGCIATAPHGAMTCPRGLLRPLCLAVVPRLSGGFHAFCSLVGFLRTFARGFWAAASLPYAKRGTYRMATLRSGNCAPLPLAPSSHVLSPWLLPTSIVAALLPISSPLHPPVVGLLGSRMAPRGPSRWGWPVGQAWTLLFTRSRRSSIVTQVGLMWRWTVPTPSTPSTAAPSLTLSLVASRVSGIGLIPFMGSRPSSLSAGLVPCLR